MNTKNIDIQAVSDEEFSRVELIASILEPLCEDGIPKEQRQTLLIEACEKLGIGQRSLRTYLKKYRKGGINACLRKRRSDEGTNKKWSPKLIPKALELFEENPDRSTAKIHEFLTHDPKLGQIARSISTSCLYQQMIKAGINFSSIKKRQPPRTFRSFTAEHPNVLWQSDARHGIPIPHPTKPNKTKMTYLFCWLDDYSRLILNAAYSYDEKVPRLEATFKQAALAYGLPDKVYLDNGSAYVSKQFALHLCDLNVRKIHHPPYQAWCKGKIEAVMKILKKFQREAFLAGFQTLNELNSALNAWIDVEYNRKVHSATGETPLNRYMKGIEKRPARYISDLTAFNEIFFWRINRTVNKYGTIPLFTNTYNVPDTAPGTTLGIRYDPLDLSTIYVFSKGRCIMKLKAKTIKRNRVAFIPEEQKLPEAKVSKNASDYFMRLREKHNKNIQEQAQGVSFENIKKQDNNNDRSN